jgi:hypothetical protein
MTCAAGRTGWWPAVAGGTWSAHLLGAASAERVCAGRDNAGAIRAWRRGLEVGCSNLMNFRLSASAFAAMCALLSGKAGLAPGYRRDCVLAGF